MNHIWSKYIQGTKTLYYTRKLRFDDMFSAQYKKLFEISERISIMKIVVLGGGISTERHVALVSGTSVCRALRERGHQAIFVDMFMGLEDYDGPLEAAFDGYGTASAAR